MGSEWKETLLGDLISVTHGYAFKGADFSETNLEGPIVVTIGNFDYAGGFRFESTRVKRCSSEYPPEYELIPGEILLVMTCQTEGGEILGIPGIIPDDSETYLHNQRLGRVILKSKNISPKYLYWLFLSRDFNQHLCATATGTKILHTAPKRIESYKFFCPSLPEQKAIAHILGSLDDKIELNRRMNATLEGLAQALFQSWFVDFDPVLDNALAAGNPIPDELSDRAAVRRQALDNGTANRKAAQHFPATFQFTEELGWIPEGWEVRCIADLCSTVTDGSHHSPKSVDEKSGLPMASSKDLTGLGINYESCRFISKEDFTDLERNGCSPNLGDVLIAKDGARCGETCCIHRNEAPVVLLSSVAILRPNSPNLSTFLNTLMSRAESVADLRENYVSGSAIPRIILRDFKRFPVITFPSPILERWALYSQHLHQRATDSQKQSETLTKLRDTILPQLISGELRIPDAAKLAEEALT